MGFLDKLFGKKQEVSPGGSAIYRYEALQDRELQTPTRIGVYASEVEAHFETLFPGRESRVLHEIVSDLIHVDIHVMWPTAAEPFFVVYTTGMSDLPMTVPKEIEPAQRRDLELAELYLFLPGDWPLSPDSPPEENAFWPIGIMKAMARFPHQYKTWLAYGHTVPNGPDYAPLHKSVGFGGVAFNCGTGPLSTMTAKDGRLLHLYQMLPLYKEEIEYKLKFGMEGLQKVFEEKGLEPVLDPKRPNLCPDFTEILDS